MGQTSFREESRSGGPDMEIKTEVVIESQMLELS